jgi:probable phosphomutase (TIGR03848 family)
VSLLLLIRHAVTDQTGTVLYGRTPGLSLSATGREQAQALAGRLAPFPIEAIYSSPLERCLETANPLAESKGVEIQTSEALLEGDTGEWTGRKLSDLRRTREWRTVTTTPSQFRYPGGESFPEFQTRMLGETRRIAEAHPDGVVAVVSHGDNIRLVLAHYAGAHLDLFFRTVVYPASASAVSVPPGGGVPYVLRVNETGTMEDLVPRRRRRLRGR